MKSVGMTTGAFYGYYKSKEELFAALVEEHYRYILDRFLPGSGGIRQAASGEAAGALGDSSGPCMSDILHYAYEHLEDCQLLLCSSEGTRFAGLVDQMVEIEVNATHAIRRF